MSNNYWNQQRDGNHAAGNNGAPRSGSLLRDYANQSYQAGPQFTPPAGPTAQGVPPYAPPPPQVPQAAPPQQQAGPRAQGLASPTFFANAMQTVRRWSGKMVAARVGDVTQGPLVLYRPPSARPLPARPKPWKRSRSVRIAMQMRHRRERWQQARPGPRRIWTIIVTVFALLLVIAISSGTASAFAYYQSELPHVQQLANQQVDQTTHIYDRNGQLIYIAYDNREGRRIPVTFNYIPGVMQDAMTSAEDPTFWDNSGIDPQGILRAATQYASSGSVESGGSTLTQQLVKNLTHDNQVSLQRKLPEAALAVGLTQQYPKWKILEMYLNVSPFGAQELGVEAAVEDYFGLKPQCDKNFKCIPALANLDFDPKTGKHNYLLALARASLLAGLPQNPVSYDPSLGSEHVKLALARQDYVLNQMLSHNMNVNLGLGDQTKDYGPITQDMINQVEAMTAKMPFLGFHYFKHDPHFVDWIIPILETALGNGDERQGVHLFLTGGFNIRTTIDSKLESYVENNVRHHLRDQEYQIFVGDWGPLNTVHNVNDSAVVVMNAKTGEVLAMDGSADYNSSDARIAGNVNAALARRQPGSSFKPIVYATAFQMGWYPGIVLPDHKTYFPNGGPVGGDINTTTYHPFDYGQTYHNINSNIVLDIANSFNIPAVKTLEFAGFDNVLNMARRFGITDIDADAAEYNRIHHSHISVAQDEGPSMALGTAGVSLLQMVGAYQVFANQGTRIPPQGILDIWDNYGHHLYHYNPAHPSGARVISPQIAFLMSSILSNNEARAIEFSGDPVLTMQDWDGRPVAAKTGTTDNFQDNWTIGYTPDVVVGVWSGNANGDFMNRVVGITGAAPIWHDVIEYASGRCNPGCGDLKFAPEQFVPPPGVIQQAVNTVNGLAGSGYITWMLESDVPQQSGIVTKNNNGNGSPTATPTP
jgi:membrane peptidoglycan carboxypeptidase